MSEEELGLFSGRTGGTHGDVLGRNGIEKLGTNGDTHGGEIAEDLTSDTNALVDFEGVVDVGVVDETFPSDGCAGLLAVI